MGSGWTCQSVAIIESNRGSSSGSRLNDRRPKRRADSRPFSAVSKAGGKGKPRRPDFFSSLLWGRGGRAANNLQAPFRRNREVNKSQIFNAIEWRGAKCRSCYSKREYEIRAKTCQNTPHFEVGLSVLETDTPIRFANYGSGFRNSGDFVSGAMGDQCVCVDHSRPARGPAMRRERGSQAGCD